jgi:hypothetical protein
VIGERLEKFKPPALLVKIMGKYTCQRTAYEVRRYLSKSLVRALVLHPISPEAGASSTVPHIKLPL